MLKLLLVFFLAFNLNASYLGNKTKKGIVAKTTSSLIKKKATKQVTNKAIGKFVEKVKIPYDKKLSKKKLDELKKKIDNRTITKEEYEEYNWNRKIDKARAEGVRKFYQNEKEVLKNGEKGARNYTEKMKEEIINGKRPTFNGKPLEGHHKYSVEKYPNLAKEPTNIYPTTKDEHLHRWHGGNYRNPTLGTPINPKFKEEF